jgi:curli biogenesis system outer membrane secretion channel CsgG
MKKMYSAFLCCVSLVCVAVLAGCSAGKMTTFAEDEPVPDSLDMKYEGGRANIAVGDFTVKARGATLWIGDALREMMETALFESKRFNVLDRLDMDGLTAEQKLSYTKLVRPDAPKLGRQLDVAELLVYGTVSEFEDEAMGAGVQAEMDKMPATASVDGKIAHMAIDIRVVDAATGRLVAARRIKGDAASGQATGGFKVGGGSSETPISLGAYANTPMELAIRDCIYRSVIYMTEYIPGRYFSY